MTRTVTRVIAVILALLVLVWIVSRDDKTDSVVGSWYVKAADAPFQFHMFMFHVDGTMSQANPDFGDPGTSDSDGAGVWRRYGDVITGKFVEVTADRGTHQFASRGEIHFQLSVHGDHFSGRADAYFFDAAGNYLRGPLSTPLEGTRITT